jgi:hypothetical protein
MPILEHDNRNQKAVYWPPAGQDFQNEPLRGAPQELTVRWITDRREAVLPDGTTVMLDAKVILAPHVVAVGGFMWLGTLAAATAGTFDDEPREIMQIVRQDEVPDIKGIETFRSAGLMRWRGTLPELAS